MELDDLKQNWKALDARLQQTQQILMHQHREGVVIKAQSSLRPLVFGQITQILVGILVILFALQSWPKQNSLNVIFFAGIIVHLYGVAVVMLSGINLTLIKGIDLKLPVLDLQKRLAHLQRQYVLTGMIVGFSWLVLWIPFAIVIFDVLFGINFYANAPKTNLWLVFVGIIGLLGTWSAYRWVQDPKRTKLAAKFRNGMSSASVVKAQQQLEELKQFEQE